MGEEYLTTEEAAARLRVNVETIRRWCRAGRLRTVKIGRAHRIPLRAILSAPSASLTAEARTLADRTAPQPEPTPLAQPAEPPAEHARRPVTPHRRTMPAADDPDEQLQAGWTRADPMPDDRLAHGEHGMGYGGRIVIIE